MSRQLHALHSRRPATTWVGAAALLVVTAFLVSQTSAIAKHTDDHVPANKVAVAGSTVAIAGPDQEIPLLETTMRNAASKALVLQVTLECSILTALTTVGNDHARAESTLEVWVEVNGRRVTVSDADNGEVTFCNREYQRTTTLFDDEDATIDDFIDTKQAHGFNWVDLSPGNGIQEIVVWGRLTTAATPENATATVAVGNRTLVVEPVDVAHGETKNN